jgi:hypothetical protein
VVEVATTVGLGFTTASVTKTEVMFPFPAPRIAGGVHLVVSVLVDSVACCMVLPFTP